MDGITFPVDLYITSGLLILLHGVNTLPDATSYDKLRNMNYLVNVCYNVACP